jgi:menaquinone-dependent protoporphyrinogen oxidase
LHREPGGAVTVPEGIVLVVYASKHGSTEEVARAIARRVEEAGPAVHVASARALDGSIGDVRAVVLGGSLYTGRLHRDARRFLDRHRAELAVVPFAMFAMGPRTTSDKDMAGARAQLHHALLHTPELQPQPVAIFGGVLDPAKLHFPFNRMPASDARDWHAIDGFADEVIARLTAPEAVTTS